MFYLKEEQRSTVSEWDMNYRERRRLVGGARALAVTFLSYEPASQPAAHGRFALKVAWARRPSEGPFCSSPW